MFEPSYIEELYDKINTFMSSGIRDFNKNFEVLLDCMRGTMKWEPKSNDKYHYTYYVCSHCKSLSVSCTDFCPSCGAKWVKDDAN